MILMEYTLKIYLKIGHKIYIQKSVAFLHTNNEFSKRETKKAILLATASKRIKYLRKKLSQRGEQPVL